MACHLPLFLKCFCSIQDRKLTVTEEPAGNGRPGMLHFQSRPTVAKTIQWDAVLSSSALYVEIPRDPLPEGSKERWVHVAENWWRQDKLRQTLILFVFHFDPFLLFPSVLQLSWSLLKNIWKSLACLSAFTRTEMIVVRALCFSCSCWFEKIIYLICFSAFSPLS